LRISRPRLRWLIAGIVACALPCVAQESAIRYGLREINVYAGGGFGLGERTSYQYANAGVRAGIVLTDAHGPGFLRGNFEYAAEISPLYLFFQPVKLADGTRGREIVYGAAVSPLVLKWNFTSGKKLIPYLALEGAAILTTKDVPAGDTSVVNFGSGVAVGLQYLCNDRHTVAVSGRLLHVSNASIGDYNPSINLGVQLRLEYQWWR